MSKDIQQAIQTLNQGGIVIFPTDTAFGIGCRVDKQEAIERLYKVRKRPETQAMSLLVDGISMAKEYVTIIPDKVQKELLDLYWPGALTVVLPAIEEKVPSLVRGGGKTVGVRMPDHKEFLEVITGTGVPILGPSANFHGEKTPFAMEELNPELIKKVDFVLEGKCKQQLASTVIDCTVTPWKVLRQGAITL